MKSSKRCAGEWHCGPLAGNKQGQGVYSERFPPGGESFAAAGTTSSARFARVGLPRLATLDAAVDYLGSVLILTLRENDVVSPPLLRFIHRTVGGTHQAIAVRWNPLRARVDRRDTD